MARKINLKVTIQELYKAFEYLNRDFFEGKLKTPAITVQSQGNNQNCMAWFTPCEIWEDAITKERVCEINFVAEYLNRGMLPLIHDLLHEMVHYQCYVNKVKNTSRGGTYHNKNFKIEAEKRGLMFESCDSQYGWAFDKLQQKTINIIMSYGIKEDAFGFARKPTSNHKNDKEGSEKKKSSTRKYSCPKCGTSIRATKNVNVICGDCLIRMVTEEELAEFINSQQFVCNECGTISEGGALNKGKCPECGSKVKLLIEEDDKLINEDGKLEDVKQGKLLI